MGCIHICAMQVFIRRFGLCCVRCAQQACAYLEDVFESSLATGGGLQETKAGGVATPVWRRTG